MFPLAPITFGRLPALCGEKCHDEQLETYAESVHGKEVLDKNNAKGPVCTSCHTNHEITNTSLDSFKLLNNEECGNCHKDRLKTYRDTYHGQVTKLGYAETAKCYNCHGSHGVARRIPPRAPGPVSAAGGCGRVGQIYLVDAPSRPMTLGSKILGLTLIAAGLTLLVLVAVGFFSVGS